MYIDLERLKNMVAGKEQLFETDGSSQKKGEPMQFENQEALERAKRTLQHFKARGFAV